MEYVVLLEKLGEVRLHRTAKASYRRPEHHVKGKEFHPGNDEKPF